MKKYEIIYADPPWQYTNKNVGGNGTSGAEAQYPTMDMQSLKELGEKLYPVTGKNAILFLWAVSPLLPEAIELMRSWGFEYKSSAVWDKMTPGMGYWFRGQHEILLVGVKGNVTPPPVGLRISSIFQSKKKQHSTKPAFLKPIISEWYPDAQKFELFARINEQGIFVEDRWDVWGNEIKNSIEL